MQVDWTTFALEIVNFLILVWILKRFLYRPVMAMIERRRAAITQRLADADARLKQAQDLEQQHREQLSHFEQERQKTRAALHEEIEKERARLLGKLKTEVEQERQKAQAVEARREEEARRHVELDALNLGGRFVARLLSRIASPEIEAQLIAAACEDLRKLPEAQRETLRTAARSAGATATVASRFVLAEGQRSALMEALREAAGAEFACTTRQDETLLAGLSIEIGSWVLRANLRDELRFFTESGRADP